MRPTVYIETTIPSYLTAWPSRDLIRAAEQQITREWWTRRSEYELRVSSLVLVECQRGDPSAAEARLASLQGILRLETTPEADALAQRLIEEVPFPSKAVSDAFHIAIAAVNRVDFLLTWNCRHIANAMLRPKIESVCQKLSLTPPVICTPSELMTGEVQ